MSVVAAAEYGRIEKQLAAQFPTDMASYIAGKTAYILTALRNVAFPSLCRGASEAIIYINSIS
jgi:hypothetical protein